MEFYKDSDNETIDVSDQIEVRFTSASFDSQPQKIQYIDKRDLEIDQITKMQYSMILPQIYNSILEKNEDLPKSIDQLKKFTILKNFTLPDDFFSSKFIKSLIPLIKPEENEDDELIYHLMINTLICLINIFYECEDVSLLYNDELINFIIEMLSNSVNGDLLFYVLNLLLNVIDKSTIEYIMNSNIIDSFQPLLENFVNMETDLDRNIFRLIIKCLRSITFYNDQPELIDSLISCSEILVTKIACPQEDIHKEVFSLIFQWIKKSDDILNMLTNNLIFEVIPYLCQRPGMECFSSYFGLYTFLIHKRIQFDNSPIYESLNIWEKSQKYDELAYAAPNITDFLLKDMDRSVEDFESYLQILLERKASNEKNEYVPFKPIEKNCLGVLLLKYILILPLIKSEEKAKEYFPMIFDMIPYFEYNYMKQSLTFLENLIQKHSDFIIISLDSGIDEKMFENLEREDPDLNVMIDILYDQIHE